MDALKAAQAHIAASPGVTNEAAAAFALGYAAALSDGGGSDAPTTAEGSCAASGGTASESEEEHEKQAMAVAARGLLKARRPVRTRSYDSDSGSPSVYK
eukprot:gene27143-34565_t